MKSSPSTMTHGAPPGAGWLAGLGLPATGVAVVYDGECPLCSSFVGALRIRREFGTLALIDARQRPELVAACRAAGLDLDDGFLCVIEGAVYHCGDAVNVLTLVSSRSSLLNRINYRVFANRRVSMVLYPFLRAMRNGLLKLRGAKQLDALHEPGWPKAP